MSIERRERVKAIYQRQNMQKMKTNWVEWEAGKIRSQG